MFWKCSLCITEYKGGHLFLLFCRKISYLFFHSIGRSPFMKNQVLLRMKNLILNIKYYFEVIWFWRVSVATRKLEVHNFQHLFTFPHPFFHAWGWNLQNLMVKVIFALFFRRLCVRKKTVPYHRHLDPLCLTGIFQLLATYSPVQLWRMWEYPQVLSEGKNIEIMHVCGTNAHNAFPEKGTLK